MAEFPDHPTWHYVNIPVFIGPERAISVNRSMEYPTELDQSQWNVAQAVKHCLLTLASSASPQDKALAICWLNHLVGLRLLCRLGGGGGQDGEPAGSHN